MGRNGGRGWSDRIRRASYTDLWAVGASDRQGPPRHQARRPPGRAADQVRARRQPKNRQGARADHPRILPRPRRPGDRISAPALAVFSAGPPELIAPTRDKAKEWGATAPVVLPPGRGERAQIGVHADD